MSVNIFLFSTLKLPVYSMQYTMESFCNHCRMLYKSPAYSVEIS